MAKKYAVFTMDVESFADTECVGYSGASVNDDLLDGMEEYIRLLDKYNIKSTLFTVGRLVPQIADRLRDFVRNGHHVALHSLDHVAPMRQSVKQFRRETRRAKKMVNDVLGVDVVGYRAPCFSIDHERLDVLRELGFAYDASYLDFPARHTVPVDLSDYESVRGNMFRKDGFYEFGVSQSRLFGHRYPISGGGYVRLGHWGYIKKLIQRHVRQNDYYVFYLHPFEMTKKKVPAIKSLRSYDRFYLQYGIKSYCRKVEQIIEMLRREDYEFVTYEELVHILNRDAATA